MYARNQSLFVDEARVNVPAMETEIGQDDLPPYKLISKSPSKSASSSPSSFRFYPSENDGVRIENEVVCARRDVTTGYGVQEYSCRLNPLSSVLRLSREPTAWPFQSCSHQWPALVRRPC